MGYPNNVTQSRADKDCKEDCKKDCKKGCPDISTNAPQSPCPPLTAHTTYNSVEARIRMYIYSEQRVKSECYEIPLKYGGSLKLGWNCTDALNRFYVSLRDSPVGWIPGGNGGYFSFFPYLPYSGYAQGFYDRLNEFGLMRYRSVGVPVNGITYYDSVNPSSYKAWYDSNTTYFTEYDRETQTYFVYAGDGPGSPISSMSGRPIQIIDRNGNTLQYHYTNNQQGKPLLRKITGDLPGITPYFEYENESYPAPITKIYLHVDNEPSESRTIYFRYNSNLDPNAFLREIEYPEGCVRGYDLFGDNAWGHTFIRKEEDSLGYTTYFEYTSYQGMWRTASSSEPENAYTYYTYDLYTPFTAAQPVGRPPTYYYYTLLASPVSLPQVSKATDALGHTTYYEWNTPLNRVSKQHDPNGKISYFEYNSQGILQKKIEDGIVSAYYTYEDSLVSPSSMTNVRGYTTYFEYDAHQNPIVVVDALGNRTEKELNSNGQVIKETDARGNCTYFEYDPDTGKLHATIDAKENVTYYSYNVWGSQVYQISPRWEETGDFSDFTTYYEYDKRNRLTTIIDPLGNVTYYEYTVRGDLLAKIDPRGVETYYDYNGLRLMIMRAVKNSEGQTVQSQYYGYDSYKNRIWEENPRGFITYFTYDALDRLTAVKNPLGHTSYYDYDSVGNQTLVLDALGHPTYYFYDKRSRLEKTLDALGNETYYEYDAIGNTTATVDARENATYFYYDELDRQKGIIDALGNETYFQFDAVGNRTVVVDAKGNATYFYYDELNRQKGIIDALGNETYFEFDAAGNQTAVVDARENATYFYYDELNRRKGIIDALGNATYFEFDAVGNQTAVVDARANATYFYYDALSRQKGTIDALGNETYYEFDEAGNRITTVDARGNATYFTYDAMNRLTCTTDALDNQTYFEFDEGGNQTAVVDAKGNVTYFYYDELNRQKGIINAVGNETYFEFDEAGNRTAIVAPLDLATYFVYDELNRVSSQQDPEGAWTYFTYDESGNLESLSDSLNQTTYYTYDELSRLHSSTNALQQTEYYTYDPTSNLIEYKDSDGITTYHEYDELSRKTRVIYPDQTFEFGYDEVSNLTKSMDERGWTYFTFDALNRQTQDIQPNGQTVYYTYNEIGQRIQLNSVAGTPYYTYDSAGRLLQVDQSGVVSDIGTTYYTYDKVGNVTRKILGNGCFTYFEYDPNNRVTHVLNCLSDGSPLAYFEYTYDEAGRITRCLRENGAAVYYTYDRASRLTSETWLDSSDQQLYAFQWDYDNVGNRIWQSRDGEQTYYYYDKGNALAYFEIDASFTYFTYDSRGNCTRIHAPDGVTYFTYNHANLVTSIRYKDDTWNRFYYDALLCRYAIEDSQGLAYFVWDANRVNLLPELDTNGNVTAEYTHGYTPIQGIGSLVAAKKQVQDTTYYQYPIYDHRGTVVRLTDEAGAVSAYYEYSAFGVPLRDEENPPVGNRFRYQSNWIVIKDSGGELVLSPTRIYHAGLGCFLQRDFLKRELHIGSYLFAKNSPLNFADSFGLQESQKKYPEDKFAQERRRLRWIIAIRNNFLKILSAMTQGKLRFEGGYFTETFSKKSDDVSTQLQNTLNDATLDCQGQVLLLLYLALEEVYTKDIVNKAKKESPEGLKYNLFLSPEKHSFIPLQLIGIEEPGKENPQNILPTKEKDLKTGDIIISVDYNKIVVGGAWVTIYERWATVYLGAGRVFVPGLGIVKTNDPFWDKFTNYSFYRVDLEKFEEQQKIRCFCPTPQKVK